MKETIAKALYYNFHNWTTSWEQQDIHIKLPFYGEAEAVIKALEADSETTEMCSRTNRPCYTAMTGFECGYRKEADVPKELEECLLSEDERYNKIIETFGDGDISSKELTRVIAKAQLAKVAPYIEAVKKAERERIRAILTDKMGSNGVDYLLGVQEESK